MTAKHFLIARLRSNLAAVLEQQYSSKQLNEIVLLCHSTAVSFLEIKCAQGSFNRELVNLSISDAAYDCIADLFRRDTSEKFIALNSYFSAFNIQSLTDVELFSHLRRLVFTKVNDGIARLYHESDPALSKIIRNIRLAVHTLGSFVEIERFGEIYLAPAMCDINEHLPKFDETALEEFLFRTVQGDENVLEITGAIVKMMKEQNTYARMVDIMQIAFVIRSLYARKALLTAGGISETQHSNEAFETIKTVLQKLQSKLFPRYVAIGKITEQLYITYFNVVTQKIEQMMFDGSADGQSLFHTLQQQLPEITEEEYRTKHKARLEYLFKLSCEEAVKEIRR